ncbi:MAG: DMT family transporter [Candidatus Aenigmarchaeota archaeon]|nr:DMT family transporter [Candidatus Aenigmarchaeota archaeon]
MKRLRDFFKNSSYAGFLYAILSVVFMSPIFIIVSIVTREMPTETANFMFFGSGLLVTFAISTMQKKNTHIIKLARNHFRPLFLLGAINAAAAILFFMGIKAIGPSTAAFISRFETVFTIFLGAVILKEKFGKVDALGIAITVIGALLITYSDVSIALGSFLILASSVIISFQRILLKKHVSRIRPSELNQLRLLFTTSLLLVYVVATSKLVVPSVGNALLIMLGGIMAPVIGFYFMLKSMERMEVSKTMTIKAIEPFAVIVMASTLLGSSISPEQVFGGGIMITGIIILAVAHKRQAVNKSQITVAVD